MLTKSKLVILSLLIALNGSLVMAPALVQADALNGDACAGLNLLQNGSNSKNCGGDSNHTLNKIVDFVVNLLSVIVGVAAVIVIIISGMKFVTSSGDSGAVKEARSGVIYAVVGLIVVAIAQVIVHFVLRGVKQ